MIIINNEKYLTSKEVSTLFDISMETVKLWRTKGILKYVQMSERKYFYPESKLLEKFNNE